MTSLSLPQSIFFLPHVLFFDIYIRCFRKNWKLLVQGQQDPLVRGKLDVSSVRPRLRIRLI